MSQPRRVPRPDRLSHGRPNPIGMRELPPGRPPAPDRLLVGERRNTQTRLDLVWRIHSEFIEMPGLRLTLPQAVRLFGIREDICTRVLASLTADRLLRRLPDGRYIRADTIR
jgi:hypothetical protein